MDNYERTVARLVKRLWTKYSQPPDNPRAGQKSSEAQCVDVRHDLNWLGGELELKADKVYPALQQRLTSLIQNDNGLISRREVMIALIDGQTNLLKAVESHQCENILRREDLLLDPAKLLKQDLDQ